MSAIAGVFFLDKRPVGRPCLQRMIDTLERRGPHGSGVWTDGPVGLAHRMLWSTPESLTETLPLRSAARGLAITADARIDNRQELRRALGVAPGAMEGIGDGELILRAYEAWGEDCPARLLGDFAFAIWDGRRQRLFCARDYFGAKPLYYFRSSRVFVFASEIKALLRLPEVPGQINEIRIADYLVDDLESVDKTSTFYQDIFRLPPAHVMTIDADTVSLRAYWSLEPREEIRCTSDEDYTAAFREKFTDAVRCRLRSASPAGSMLSGGLDSSSVVCVARDLCAQNGAGPLSTFSAVSEDESSCYEAPFVRAVVEAGGLEAHFVRPRDLESFLPDFEYVVCNSDDLFDNFLLNIPLLMYSAARKQGIRVLLDGIDGDVVASGHLRFLRYALRERRWSTVWRDARGFAHFFNRSPLGLLWTYGIRPLAPPTVKKLWRSIRPNNMASERIRGSIVDRDFALRMGLEERLQSFYQKESVRNSDSGSPGTDYCNILSAAFIPAALERYERVAAAHAIEPRHPFFDRRLVEFCAALPWEQKAPRGWTKSILRRSLAGVVPESVRWRTWAYRNLNSPFFRFLLRLQQQRLEDTIADSLAEIGGYVDQQLVKEAYERYAARGGSTDEGNAVDAEKVLKTVSLALWLRRNRKAVE